MRDLATMLAGLVIGVTAGCGGSVDKGTIGPGGQRTEGERIQGSDSCSSWEDWSYIVDDGISCDQARSLVAKCASVCGDTPNCWGIDATGRAQSTSFDGTSCTSGGARPAEIRCRKMLANACAVEGRRTHGVHVVEVEPYASVGAYFASSAHLEAAAVLAFERLARELREQGAPPALIGRMRRAAREERRHVEIISELARSFGAEPLPATAEPFEPRSLFEIARENVIEGVVRETFGAAVALFRAERAGTPQLRAALSEIAHDECRHAQLSWDLHAWMWAWLGAAERKAIETARVAAIEELRAAIEAEPADEIVTVAGVPRASEARELFDGLFESAWKKVA